MKVGSTDGGRGPSDASEVGGGAFDGGESVAGRASVASTGAG